MMKIRETLFMSLVAAGGYAARHALRSPTSSFSQDFVSRWAPLWMRHLQDFKGRPNVHLLEVGSYEGRSTLWFLENILTHPSSTITCVDTFLSRRAEVRFDHNIAVSGFASKVTKVGGRSQELLKLFKEGSYDIAYIDGSHRAADVKADSASTWPLLKIGGVVIFDDYLWHPEKPAEDRPQAAINDFLRDHGNELDLLHKGYQVIARRTGGAFALARGND